MHFVHARTLLSAQNGMNLYRGCQHGCIYCDSRSKCYQMDHDFEDIAVKENALELLEKTLKSKRKPCMIGTGSMSDPYMPLEMELQMTRRSLELIERYGFGVTMITKSDRIMRDLDILKRMNEHTKAVVQMTITTFDDSLCRLIEPNVSVTSQRMTALKQLQSAGIPTVVWLCPILPYINDTEDNIRSIIDACADAGVKGIINFGMGLTLRDGNREYYYSQLDKQFPGLKARYIRSLGNAYQLPSPKSRELSQIFHQLCDKYGLWHDNNQIFRYLSQFEEKETQMSLF